MLFRSDDAAASARLGIDAGGLGYYVAAIRECFEECGVMLALDPNGDALSFRWTQTAGPAVQLSDPAAAQPTFAAPQVDQTTILTFQLVVSDGPMSSVPDSVDIEVRDVKSVIAYGEYSWVYWNKGKGALLRKPLKQWETELPDHQFVRIHRNAIINLAFMDRVEKVSSGRLQVHLRDTVDPIAVSLRLAPGLNRKLAAFKS